MATCRTIRKGYRNGKAVQLKRRGIRMKGMQMLAGVALAAFLAFMAIRLGSGSMPGRLPCPEGAGVSECSEAMNGECPRRTGPPVSYGGAERVSAERRDAFGTDLSRFAGTWRAIDTLSAPEKKKGRAAEEYLVLGVSGRERKLNMALLTVAPSPGRRVAHVETTLPIDGRLAGHFAFTDDGWGNGGEGALSLQDGRVVVQIRLRSKSGAGWRMFSGQKVFVRQR